MILMQPSNSHSTVLCVLNSKQEERMHLLNYLHDLKPTIFWIKMGRGANIYMALLFDISSRIHRDFNRRYHRNCYWSYNCSSCWCDRSYCYYCDGTEIAS